MGKGLFMKRTGAVIVAAGLSSRMHDFKPLLAFGDSTIALHLVSMLKNLQLDPIVVVTGYRAKELEEHLFFTGVRFVKNERFSETQMLDSVKLGIAEIAEECERILIMPMDIPAILPETFAQVLSIDADIVRTRYLEKTGHPIVVRSSIAKTLLAYEGENGLKGAIDACGAAICDVDVTDEGVRRDVDTPEDYQDLIEWNYKRGNGYPVRPQIKLQFVANAVFFEEKIAELLEYVEQTGSIQEACIRVNLSYSKGSSLIKGAEHQLGESLVTRWAGGTGGGGSVLTETGKKLLRQYRYMEKELQTHASKLYREFLQQESASTDTAQERKIEGEMR
jgi:molybdate transport repressor ModE-like protein